MRALAHGSTRNHDPRASTAPRRDAAATFAEPPAETDAWWLSRSPPATFSKRRIALSDEHARALRLRGRVVVEFNGARFDGAAVAANDHGFELDLGDTLAQEMAEVLDEDDELAVEVISGRARPTVAIHPHVAR